MSILKNLLIVLTLCSCEVSFFPEKIMQKPNNNENQTIELLIDYIQECPNNHRGYNYISSKLISLNKVCYYN